MHAQQGQMFGAQAAYSQQISAQMPMAYGSGLGSTGFGGGFGPGGGFSYGGSGMGGYGPGNSFGNTMTSALGGVGQTAFGSVGMGIGGAALGYKIGGFRGAMIGGGIGVGAGSFGSGFIGSAMEGAHEQSAIERTLSQFQFQNASSRTGRGFTRTDSMAIGNMVRQMERVPEMLTSFGELNRIMDKMGQMGLMQGVRDAGEFQRKFREMITGLKDMSKILGGSMEDALKMVGESRSSGFYSQGDITRNAFQRRMVGAVTGMSQDQIGALQQYGGALGHATGGSRRTGAQHLTRTAAQFGMLNQMGIISNDDIMEYTGKEGAAGISDMAADFGQLAHRMSRGNVGNLLTLALGQQENGRFTGRMDDDLVAKFRSGQLGSLADIKRLARSKIGTRGAKLSYKAHQSRLTSEMAGSVGAEGMALELQSLLGERGWNNPDATNLVMQRFGASEEQANMLQKVIPNISEAGSQLALAGRNELRTSARNAAMKEQGWDAIKHRITKKLEHYTTDWAKDIGVSVRNYFQNWADEFLDDLTGQYTTKITKRAADELMFGGGAGSRFAHMPEINLSAGMRMDVGRSGGLSGLASRAAHWADGSRTQGERMAALMAGYGGKYATTEGGGVGGFFKKVGTLGFGGMAGALYNQATDPASRAAASGRIVLSSGVGGEAISTSQEQIDKFNRDFSQNYGFERTAGNIDRVFGEAGLSADPFVASYKKALLRTAQTGDHDKRVQMVLEQIKKDTNSEINFEKFGLTESQFVAGLQHKYEGKYGKGDKGAIDFRKASEIGAQDLSGPALRAKRKEIEKKFAGITGDELSASGSEMLKNLEDGGLMGGITEALISEKGIGEVGGITLYDPKFGVSGDFITKAIRTGNVDNIPDKVFERFGIDKAEFKKKLATDPDALRKLAAGATSDALGAVDASSLRAIDNKTAREKFAGSLKGRGLDVSERAGKLSDSGMSDKEKSVLGMLKKHGESLSGATADNYLGLDYGYDLAKSLSELDPKSAKYQELYEAAGPEIRDVMGFRKRLAGGGGKRGSLHGVAQKSGDVDAILKGANVQGGSQELRDEIRKAVKGGKTSGLDFSEIEAVTKILATVQSKLVSKPGTEAGSTHVNEQEVIKAFKDLSNNNVKMAIILGNVASGEKDLLKGYSVQEGNP